MALIRELPVTEGFEVSSESISFDAEFFVWDVIGGVLEVEQTVLAYAPVVLFQLVRGKITCKEMGPGMWHAAVHYQNLDPNRAVGIEPAKPEPPDANAAVNGPNGPKFGFDTTGGTRHAVQSNTTRGMYTNQSSDINVIAPDNNNAIGVSGESVQGVDIPDRKFEWTLEIPFPYVSIAYIIGLYHITGTVNYGQRFAGFQAPGRGGLVGVFIGTEQETAERFRKLFQEGAPDHIDGWAGQGLVWKRQSRGAEEI